MNRFCSGSRSVWTSTPSDFAAARLFWEALGFVAAEESQDPYPHLVLTSDYLDLAFHAPFLLTRGHPPPIQSHLQPLRRRGR